MTMRYLLIVGVLALAGCGGGNPNAPSPTPSPSPSPPPTFSGTVTNTVSGAPVFGFSATISNGRLVVSAPGYVTRDTRAGALTVDLIPEAGFDVAFYRQFARGTLEDPMQPLRVLPAAPSIYLQTEGLTAGDVIALEQAARAAVPALSGDRFQVQAWETGATARTPTTGWIVVTVTNDTAQPCGLTNVGASAGLVRLNSASRCGFNGRTIDPPLFAHELGHALGFYHVAASGHLMKPRATFAERTSVLPSDLERHHALIAYKRSAGNRDLDVDN